MKKEDCALFSYGITGFSFCINKETKQIEKDWLIMTYGKNKYYIFQKDKAFELIRAICGPKNPNGSEFDKDCFECDLKLMGLMKLLDSRLTGRAMLIFTKFKNPAEYVNGLQNSVVGVTGLDLDGTPFAKTKKELFKYGFADGRVFEYCTAEDFEKMEEDEHLNNLLDKNEHIYDA